MVLYSDRGTITTHFSALFKTCRVPQFSLLAIKSVLNLISTIIKIVEKYDTTLVKHILHYKMQWTDSLEIALTLCKKEPTKVRFYMDNSEIL